jgi:hypothetical protein
VRSIREPQFDGRRHRKGAARPAPGIAGNSAGVSALAGFGFLALFLLLTLPEQSLDAHDYANA